MKILVYSKYSRMGASSRMRTYMYLEPLLAKGLKFKVSPLFDDRYLKIKYRTGRTPLLYSSLLILKRIVLLPQILFYDAIWIEKEILPGFPAILERLIHLFGISYLVDYDDAIFHNYDISKNPIKRIIKNKIDIVMKLATIVTVGNSYLYERARKADAKEIVIIPTVIDYKKYISHIFNSTIQDRTIIGWIGSPSTVKYLEIVRGPLNEIAAQAKIQLVVIGANFHDENFDVKCVQWSENLEIEELYKIDIGIMPLENGLWENGKCGYKLLQYMACAKPVVASPVGVNIDIVSQGVNGFLAESTDDWITHILWLITNHKEAIKMGMNGRETIKSNYTYDINIPKMELLLNKLSS